MPTSPSLDMPFIQYARAVYRSMGGVLPLDIAADLIQEGFIVRELEEQWDKEFGF